MTDLQSVLVRLKGVAPYMPSPIGNANDGEVPPVSAVDQPGSEP